MKILYDFRPWQAFYGRGVARYIEDLFTQAIKQNSDKAYILLDKEKVQPNFPGEIKDMIIPCFLNDFIDGKFKNNEFDCFINGSACSLISSPETVIDEMYPVSVLKACKLKTSLLFDFIPLFFQLYIPNETNKISFALQYEMLKKLDHIFTDSNFVIAQATKYIGLKKENCTCLYGGADIGKFTTQNSTLLYTDTKRKNHIVYVSGAAVQKNNEGIVKAFCKAYKKGIIPKDSKFYIICKASPSFIDLIKNITESEGCKYGEQVIATDYISDKEMIDIISTAKSSIFPSFLEGLGLPILESYAAGTPCWASGMHATKEITLPECTFNPFDENSMIKAMEDIYTKPELCEKSLEYGRSLLKKITWENAAKKMLEKIDSLLTNS